MFRWSVVTLTDGMDDVLACQHSPGLPEEEPLPVGHREVSSGTVKSLEPPAIMRRGKDEPDPEPEADEAEEEEAESSACLLSWRLSSARRKAL
jgi:hypothetical protein